MIYQTKRRHGGTKNVCFHMKESNLQRLHMYDSQYMTVFKGQKYGDNKRIIDCHGLQWGEMNRWSTENFKVLENILYDIIIKTMPLYSS